MPVIARELAAAEVARIATPGTHAVGGITGLCLQVTKSGARTWLLRIKVGSTRREFGLGSVRTISLSSARDKARTLRERIGGGLDPAVQRRAARSAQRAAHSSNVTFKTCAEAFVGAEVAAGRNARYAAQVLGHLERFAFPVLGALGVRAIGTSQVLTVVEPIWEGKFATATKLRGAIERVMEYAIEHGYRSEPNPALWSGNLDAVLAKPETVCGGEHHPSLPVHELPSFIAQLRQMPGVAAQALELAIVTSTRSLDVRQMTWDDVDIQAALWMIPATRAKDTAVHRVPLNAAALRLIAARQRDIAQRLVFPAPRTGSSLSDMTLTAVVRRMNEQRVQQKQQPWIDPNLHGREVVPNGFRATFRAWAELANYEDDVISSAFTLSGTDGPWGKPAQSNRVAQRVRMMDAWGQHCDGTKRK